MKTVLILCSALLPLVLTPDGHAQRISVQGWKCDALVNWENGMLPIQSGVGLGFLDLDQRQGFFSNTPVISVEALAINRSDDAVTVDFQLLGISSDNHLNFVIVLKPGMSRLLEDSKETVSADLSVMKGTPETTEICVKTNLRKE